MSRNLILDVSSILRSNEGAAMKKSLVVVKIGDTEDMSAEIHTKQNEFLDVYSLYLRTGLKWIKDEAIMKAYELHMMDPRFSCEI